MEACRSRGYRRKVLAMLTFLMSNERVERVKMCATGTCVSRLDRRYYIWHRALRAQPALFLGPSFLSVSHTFNGRRAGVYVTPGRPTVPSETGDFIHYLEHHALPPRRHTRVHESLIEELTAMTTTALLGVSEVLLLNIRNPVFARDVFDLSERPS